MAQRFKTSVLEDMSMKTIALYLPQYHSIKENDEWWGKGYTEWTAVRSAEPLFDGHVQPKEPLNNNYYDLSDPNALAWKEQSVLAHKYGIYGFCIYHYWFKNGKQLLEKPAEILLQHKDININYCFCWANESWTRTWYGKETTVLMKQEYLGREEWEQHFNYLCKFFLDERYMKKDNCPIICIYKSQNIDCLEDMLICWREMAVKAGFSGLYIISVNTGTAGHENRVELIDAYYNHEPGLTDVYKVSKYIYLKRKIAILKNELLNKLTNKKRLRSINDIKDTYKYIDRDVFIEKKPTYKCIFPKWDNTPRRGIKGSCYINEDPVLFEETLKKMLKNYKEDYLFINAWNEWGEGCYLEPDKQFNYRFLEAIFNSTKEYISQE